MESPQLAPRRGASTPSKPPASTPGPAPAAEVPALRLTSLDALRGFDMFWIIGGEHLLRSIAQLTGSPTFVAIANRNTSHPDWHGFSFFDLIFPLLMFIAGVAIPFSFASHRARGDSPLSVHMRVIRRGLLLVLFGLIYNGALRFNFTLHWDVDAEGARHLVSDFSKVRFPSVLGRIGLGYMFAALIALHTKPRNQFLTAIGILVGYWAALKYISVPEFGAGSLYPGQTVGDYIDRNLLPGRLYRVVRDPEGLFSTIPSIANVLFGVLAGHWLKRTDYSGSAKSAVLAVAGGVSLGLAYLWNPLFPFNKNLWTSSFVLLTVGWSLLLLSIFYLLVDVWKLRGWLTFFFVVIGANAILAYLGEAFINFDGLAKIVFEQRMHKTILEAGGLFLNWCLLFFLYKQKIFLRV
jgi:predicted acyltransferase